MRRHQSKSQCGWDMCADLPHSNRGFPRPPRRAPNALRRRTCLCSPCPTSVLQLGGLNGAIQAVPVGAQVTMSAVAAETPPGDTASNDSTRIRASGFATFQTKRLLITAEAVTGGLTTSTFARSDSGGSHRRHGNENLRGTTADG